MHDNQSSSMIPTKINNIFDEIEKAEDKKYSKQNMALASTISTYSSNFRKLLCKINYLLLKDVPRDRGETECSGASVYSPVWKRLALSLNYDNVLSSKHFD